VLGPGAGFELWRRARLDLLEVLEQHRATGKVGEVTHHVLPGGGQLPCAGAARRSRRAARPRTSATPVRPWRAPPDRTAVHDDDLAALADDAALRAFVEGVDARLLRVPLALGRPEAPSRSPRSCSPAAPTGRRWSTGPDRDRAAAGWRSRMLATVPVQPEEPRLARRAGLRVAAESGPEVEVWDEVSSRQRASAASSPSGGLGHAAAADPARLHPRAKRRKLPHLVLVGKGITFDTGGLSIKPAEAMVNDEARHDRRCRRDGDDGCARRVGCPVRVTGLVAAAENAISGSSCRPR
jgi:leucyl aminopeptidase